MKTYAISVPLTDLRREPVEAKMGYEKDLLQESQLLYGERYQVHESHGDWVYIEALEQEKYYSEKGWKGYFGWIKAEHGVPAEISMPNLTVTEKWLSLYIEPELTSQQLLSVPFGTQLQGNLINADWYELKLVDGQLAYAQAYGLIGLRSKTVEELFDLVLKCFLGTPYLWGGCSSFSLNISHANTGIDCSGLSRLLYRAAGVDIPRDAKDQHLKLTKVLRPPIKCGDLFFTSTEGKIDHVMIYDGRGKFLESTFKAGGVRLI